MTERSSLGWRLRPPHLAQGPTATYGLRRQPGFSLTTSSICAPYPSRASQWSRSKVWVRFRMALNGCERVQPSFCGSRAVSVPGVLRTSYPEHVYSRFSRTHLGLSGSAPIKVLLRCRLYRPPTTRDLRYSLP